MYSTLTISLTQNVSQIFYVISQSCGTQQQLPAEWTPKSSRHAQKPSDRRQVIFTSIG